VGASRGAAEWPSGDGLHAGLGNGGEGRDGEGGSGWRRGLRRVGEVGRSNGTDESNGNFNSGEKWWLCGPNARWVGQPGLGMGQMWPGYGITIATYIIYVTYIYIHWKTGAFTPLCPWVLNHSE
jgi:hypothetical protein